ncbi:hypothetical protein FN846DRAFT_890013 [Sphaerosporella brunnea]|uniref:Uncharacterized protein n=1 Tax=Sphaerosporella brunnea TaxID=1250544 RepID=A0A5J5EXS2_9PEZI|nr:hypothetical protein FN846DRAFT_890013 [Sphaerosporella brunnea]
MKTNVMLFWLLPAFPGVSRPATQLRRRLTECSQHGPPSPLRPSTVPGFSKAAGFLIVPTPLVVPTGPTQGLAPADFGKSLLTGILGLPHSFPSTCSRCQRPSPVHCRQLGPEAPAAGVPLTILSLDVKLEVDATVEFVLLYLGVVVDGVKSIPAYIPGPNDKALGQADFSSLF